MLLYNVETKKHEELEDIIIVDEPKEKRFMVGIPHCGMYIPEMCFSHLDIESESFFLDADIYTDTLFDLVDIGAVVMKTMINRDVIDVNRSRINNTKEGVIRSISFDKSRIMKQAYSPEERELLLKQFYDSFHRKLKKEIENIWKKYGKVFLINGHSMADQSPATRKKKEDKRRPDFCLGTQDGMSADKKLLDILEAFLREQAKEIGATIQLNYPFKGYTGITSKYARPSQGYNAVILEVNKRLYLDEHQNIKPGMIRKINSILRAVISEAIKAL